MKVKRLRQFAPRASKLYATGVRPVQIYGGSVLGLSPSQLARMRAGAALAAGGAGYLPCTASLIAFRLGADADPFVSEPVRQLRSGMRLWNSSNEAERNEFTQCWRQARDIFSRIPASQRWARVAGPVSVTVVTILGSDWNSLQADLWRALFSSFVAVVGAAAWRDLHILDVFTTSVQRRL